MGNACLGRPTARCRTTPHEQHKCVFGGPQAAMRSMASGRFAFAARVGAWATRAPRSTGRGAGPSERYRVGLAASAREAFGITARPSIAEVTKSAVAAVGQLVLSDGELDRCEGKDTCQHRQHRFRGAHRTGN